MRSGVGRDGSEIGRCGGFWLVRGGIADRPPARATEQVESGVSGVGVEFLQAPSLRTRLVEVTTSMGPLFSAAIFVACGNTWSIDLVKNVMLFGTLMTSMTVRAQRCEWTARMLVEAVCGARKARGASFCGA